LCQLEAKSRVGRCQGPSNQSDGLLFGMPLHLLLSQL